MKLAEQIDGQINKGFEPLEAYDQILQDFKLDEEIILNFEYEADKAGLIDELDLNPKEIDLIKKQISQLLFNEFVKEI